MRHFVALFFAFILTTSSSYAQSVLLQGGPWTPGHAPMYLGQGSTQPIVQDSGPAAGGALGLGLSEQLLVNRANSYPAANAGTGPNGTNWCDYDAPITNASGYHYLCFGANSAGGGLLQYGAAGSAAQLPFQFLINGVSYSFPLSIADLTPIPANSIVGNDSNAAATPAAISISQCLNALTYTSGLGFGCNTLAGTGTMTSAALSMPPIFTVVGSPITTSGTFAVSLADQNANLVFAGPSSGSAAGPAFRALVSADLPAISGSNFSPQSANTVFAGPSSGGSAQPGFRALVGADFGAQSANTAFMGPASGTSAPTFRQPTAADVQFTQTGTGAVARTLQSKLGEFVSIGDFGAKCDGTTDDTTAIQNTWNAAAALGLNANLSGMGTVCKFSSISMPSPTQRDVGIVPPVASMLVGNGPNSVELVSTVTGTTCAITVTVPFTNFQPSGQMGGFALVQSSNASPSAGGYGICLNQVTTLELSNIFVRGFKKGLVATDTINLHIHDSTFYFNDWNIDGEAGSNTRPNAWLIGPRNVIGWSQQYGIFLTHPAEVNISNNTFEENGLNASLDPATIQCNGGPIDGSVGCNIENNYFEFGQINEILLASLSGDTIAGTNRIVGNIFGRNAEVNPILIANLASVNLIVTIENNGFLDNGTFSHAYIAASNPSTATYQIFCKGNTYSNGADMPSSKCLTPGANATWSMDANGIYGGP